MFASFRLVTVAVVLGAIGLSACTDPAIQQKVTDLETRVKALEDKGAKPATAGGDKAAPPAADDPREKAAMDLYKAASEAATQGRSDEAKQKLQEVQEQYAGTRAVQAAARLMGELSVVGKDIAELKTDEWYVGKGSLADGKATMVVFWEVWCPHCKREVPKLEATYQQYKGQGFNIIGLTKLSRGKTVDEVKAFIAENKVSYPMGKEAGDMSEFFAVSGVPAAAVVKGGKVVWRGHPAQVTEDMIKGWIN